MMSVNSSQDSAVPGDAVKEAYEPNQVWGLFMVLTIVYGFILAFMQHGTSAIGVIIEGLWAIYASPAVLTYDYFALAGVGPAFINSGTAGLLILFVFKRAQLPPGAPKMIVFGLVMGAALLGKNPVNMIPILFGAYLFSLYKKEPYKTYVTMAGFCTCLAPVVSQPAFIPEVVNAVGVFGGVVMGVVLGIFFGFVINAKAVFIRKSHEGLNLYNIGWGAGLLAIGLTAVYRAMGIQPFGPGTGTTPGIALAAGSLNIELTIYLAGIAVFFIVAGLLAGGRHDKLSEILYMKADDNLFYREYGKGHTYLAMGILGTLGLALTLVFKINLNAPVVGAIVSMVGWAGFGKAVVNCVTIIAGVMLGGLAKYFEDPSFFGSGVSIYAFYSTQSVIWTSAFWGTCLSPMAEYFGWRWGLLIGAAHFCFASTIAPFHFGQNLYNNGLAAGFVCVTMIPIIRSFDRAGKYPPRAF